MTIIPMNCKSSIDSSSVSSLNVVSYNYCISADKIDSLNREPGRRDNNSYQINNQPYVAADITQYKSNELVIQKPIPELINEVQKGQKVLLSNMPLSNIDVRIGWNVTNQRCDIDISAFMLSKSGKVLGDNWFVFYGQESSPDGSLNFKVINDNYDREMINVDFSKLDGAVQKIVFVLTINDAFEKHLNFGMVKDAYIRIINNADNTELVSYKMSDYYSNVISMMIGELYIHNNSWKFNAVGNGVAKDLAGLCSIYGVEVV